MAVDGAHGGWTPHGRDVALGRVYGLTLGAALLLCGLVSGAAAAPGVHARVIAPSTSDLAVHDGRHPVPLNLNEPRPRTVSVLPETLAATLAWCRRGRIQHDLDLPLLGRTRVALRIAGGLRSTRFSLRASISF